MAPLRRRLLWSGLVGLCLDALLATFATLVVVTGLLMPPLPQPLFVLLAVVVLGGLSLVEIPLMVFALRHLAAGQRGNRRLLPALNALYVFFAGVYGAPVLLITGNLVWGWILCGLGLIRLATTLLLVRQPELEAHP
jgi:hypothetical protein